MREFNIGNSHNNKLVCVLLGVYSLSTLLLLKSLKFREYFLRYYRQPSRFWVLSPFPISPIPFQLLNSWEWTKCSCNNMWYSTVVVTLVTMCHKAKNNIISYISIIILLLSMKMSEKYMLPDTWVVVNNGRYDSELQKISEMRAKTTKFQ